MPLDLFGGEEKPVPQKNISLENETSNIPKPNAPKDLFAKEAKEDRWRTGDLAPIRRNLDTGEWSWAVPNFVNGIIDAVKLPGEVLAGEVDPMSESGFERAMNLALMATPAPFMKGGGMKGATGEVISESVEKLPGGIGKGAISKELEGGTSGTATGKPADYILPPKPNAPAKVTQTVSDQELDAIFGKAEQNYRKANRVMGGEAITSPGYVNTTTKGINKAEVVGKEVTGELGYRGEAIKIFDELEPNKKAELKLRQAERVKQAAEAGDDFVFRSEIDKAFILNGNVKGMSTDLATVLEGSKNAVKVLDDPKKVEKFTESLAKSKEKPVTWGDKVFEYWVNALLSGPQTHLVNTISNSLVNVWGLAEAGVAAGISKGTKSGLSFKEVGARAYGDVEGLGDALTAMGAAFRSEKELFDTGRGGKFEGKMRSIPGPIGRVIRLPGRALTAEDAFFKTLAYRQELNGLAVRNAQKEGHTGPALANRIAELRTNPTEEMMKMSVEYSKKQTFTNGLGRSGKFIQLFLQSHPLAHIVVPFFRTSANLMKYSWMERTPVGLLFKETRDNLFGKNGAIKRDQAISKQVMGASIGAYIAYQTAQGNITGYGPSNPNERRTWLKTHQPYSIRLGPQGNWHAYGRLEPLGTIFGFAADMQELKGEMTDVEIGTVANLLVESMSRNVASKTWLTGPISLAEAMNDPTRYGEQYLQRMAGTIVPAGIAQLARAEDPYLREAETIMDGVKARIPGMRETLTARHDVTGEPMMNEGGFINNLFNPIYSKAAKDDPTIAEMLRLKVFPGRLSKTMGGVELSPEEWQFHTQVTGKTVKMALDTVTHHPIYAELPDGFKKKLMEDAVRKGRDIARDATKARFAEDLFIRMAEMKSKLLMMGLPPPTDAEPDQEALEPPPL